MPTAHPTHTPRTPSRHDWSARRTSWRERFRRWRRSRPLWAGALAVLAGAEILLIPLSGSRFVLVGGIGAVGSLLCAALLAGTGTYLCVHPERARTVGLAIITVGLASYLVANLGGFLLGMVLALISGSLAFAWRPVSVQ
jgi:hypothetical protein